MSKQVILKLGAILDERQLKQKDFAAMCGISENGIGKLANNRITAIRLDTLTMLCTTLNVQPGDLFEVREVS